MATHSHNMIRGSVRLTDQGIELGEWYDSVTHKMDQWYDNVTEVYDDDEMTIYADTAGKDAAYWAGMLGYTWETVEEIFQNSARERISHYKDVFDDADPVVFVR